MNAKAKEIRTQKDRQCPFRFYLNGELQCRRYDEIKECELEECDIR